MQNLDRLNTLLEGYERDQLSGLSDMSRLQRLTTEVVAIIEMFASVVCLGKVPSPVEAKIDETFTRISQKVGIDYEAEKRKHIQQCVPKAVVQPSAVEAWTPPQDMVEAMYQPWYRQEQARLATASAESAVAKLEALEEPPATWKDTKRAWLDSKRVEIERLREERDESRKRATRFRNWDLTENEQRTERDALAKLVAQQGADLTDAQKQARTEYLQQRIFEEETGNDDFFPTPDDIIERYILPQIGALPPGALILEPSAGRGNIADLVRREYPQATVEVVELSTIRREFLWHKGYTVVGTDFMEAGVASKNARGRITMDPAWIQRYDAVVMNPPFLKGAGREHVLHAVRMLKPGGKLVAVMPTGWADGSSRENTYFQGRMKKYGSYDVEIILQQEYNKEHDRKIVIDIAIMTFTKSAEARAEVESGDIKQDVKAITAKWASERIEIPEDAGEVDTEFRAPQFVTARPELTTLAPRDYFTAKEKQAYPFIKPHVWEGVNKAIYSLDANGGFLLADGTGTGKTFQALLTARHYYQQTGKPILIFTVDDRVIQGSFFADARKAGWETPDYIDTATSKRPKRPKNYQGLYDGGEPSVWLYKPERGMMPGINITTYNILSNWKGFEAEQQALDEARDAMKAQRALYSAELKSIAEQMETKYPKRNGKRIKPEGTLGIKDETAQLKAEARARLIDEHPASRNLYLAEQTYKNSVLTAMSDFMAEAPLVIFDEAHKVKNAGDGADTSGQSIRARLALAIINQVPKVMYMTATPADRPFDILYLKKLGFWRDEQEFKLSMRYIGYEWEEAKKNKQGEVIRDGQWKQRSNFTPGEYSGANGEMRRLFATATEDGSMLRREIELTNLTVKVHKFSAPDSALALMDEIVEGYTEVVNGRTVVDWGAAIMVQMQELERYKIAKAIEVIDEAVRRGRQVVVFANTVAEGDEEREATGMTKGGTVETVKNTLAKRYGEDKVGVLVGTSGDYEDFRRLENVQRFQKGELRVIVGTITSGGTGVNLDDTTGRNPREMVIITPPLSFINVMQGIGRVVRANTKSRSTAHFIFTDNTEVDEWLSKLLATKFATLSATVEGESGRLNPDELDKTEDAGDTGVISLVGEQKQDVDKPRRHPLLVKSNRRWEGWTMPTNVPLWVESYGTPKNSTIGIGGQTRADLDRFMQTHGALIEELGLTVNPTVSMQKYRGTYLGKWFKGRDEDYMNTLEQLLNVIDPRVASIAGSSKAFLPGQTAVTTETIDWAGIAPGTTVKVVVARKKMSETDIQRYDIEYDGRIYKSILGYQLRSTTKDASESAYKVGQTWSYRQRYHERLRKVTVSEVRPHEVVLEVAEWYPDHYTGRPSYYGGQKHEVPRKDTPNIETLTIDTLDMPRYIENSFMPPREPGERYGGWNPWELDNGEGQDGSYSRVADNLGDDLSSRLNDMLTCLGDDQSDRACRLRREVGEIKAMLTPKVIAKLKEKDYTKASMLRIAVERMAHQVGGAGGLNECPDCPPKETDGKLCISKDCLAKLERACEVGSQTWSHHAGTTAYQSYDSLPKWFDKKYAHWYDLGKGKGMTPAPANAKRLNLHKRIIDKLKAQTTCHPVGSSKPVAVLTGGAPGSGKSSYIREKAPWLLDDSLFMHIDADEMRAQLPEYRGWNATLTHEESSLLVKIALKEIAVPCHRDVLYDGTMNNPDKYKALIAMLRELGYDVYVIYMDVPKKVSKERVLKRYQSSGRYVPTYVIDDFFAGGRDALGEIAPLVDGWVKVDGVTRKEIAQGGKAIPKHPRHTNGEKKKTVAPDVAVTETVTKPITAIKTDTTRFQPRTGLNEQKVQAMIDKWDDRKLTPIDVWRDPASNDLYVLAGHHRLEAMKRLGKKRIPVKVFEGSQAEAIDFAWTSNVRGRAQTNPENARYLRRLREQGQTKKAIRETCEELYGRDCPVVETLSYLPEEARVFEDMAQFAPASDEYKELETMARWTAQVAQDHEGLSTRQLDEVYRHLRANFRITGKKYRSANEFREAIDRLLAIRFPMGAVTDEPLNLDNLRPRTDTERAFDAQEAEIEQEAREIRKQIDATRKDAVESRRGDGWSDEALLNKIRKLEERLLRLNRDLLTLREKRGDAVRSAVDSQPALFDAMTLHSFEESIRNLRWERLGVFADPGKPPILVLEGDEPKAVAINDATQYLMRGMIMTHNHPSSRGFSAEDLLIFYSSGLREMRAVAPGVTYALRATKHLAGHLGSDGEYSRDMVVRDFNRAYRPAALESGMFEIADEVAQVQKKYNLPTPKVAKDLLASVQKVHEAIGNLPQTADMDAVREVEQRYGDMYRDVWLIGMKAYFRRLKKLVARMDKELSQEYYGSSTWIKTEITMTIHDPAVAGSLTTQTERQSYLLDNA